MKNVITQDYVYTYNGHDEVQCERDGKKEEEAEEEKRTIEFILIK